MKPRAQRTASGNEHSQHAPRNAFTLFELMAVLIVIAILAGTVALSVRGHIANARLETFLDRLETFDGHARRDARRRNDFAALLFDLNDKRIYRSMRDAPGQSLAVPLGVEIEQISTNSQRSDHGVLRVTVSALGQADTYALQLRASSGRRVWLVVLGGSGQCLRFDRENDVEEMLSLQLAAPRSYAG